jgi:glutamyl-tRNA reductase
MLFQQKLRLMYIGQSIGAMKHNMQDVARAVFARQRKRLGVLTKDQEEAIESLLMSTVNKISHPIISQMRRFYESNESDED